MTPFEPKNTTTTQREHDANTKRPNTRHSIRERPPTSRQLEEQTPARTLPQLHLRHANAVPKAVEGSALIHRLFSQPREEPQPLRRPPRSLIECLISWRHGSATTTEPRPAPCESSKIGGSKGRAGGRYRAASEFARAFRLVAGGGAGVRGGAGLFGSAAAPWFPAPGFGSAAAAGLRSLDDVRILGCPGPGRSAGSRGGSLGKRSLLVGWSAVR